MQKSFFIDHDDSNSFNPDNFVLKLTGIITISSILLNGDAFWQCHGNSTEHLGNAIYYSFKNATAVDKRYYNGFFIVSIYLKYTIYVVLMSLFAYNNILSNAAVKLRKWNNTTSVF